MKKGRKRYTCDICSPKPTRQPECFEWVNGKRDPVCKGCHKKAARARALRQAAFEKVLPMWMRRWAR